MTDELAVCVAAFFRSVGKDVTTPEDFVMTSSLKMKWMSPSDSKALLALLISSNIVTSRDGFIRPNGDIGSIDVPIAYRPSTALLDRIHSKAPMSSKNEPVSRQDTREQDPDMFHILMDCAKASGINIGQFVKNCNGIQKCLNIDIAVAALLMLRDNGVSIEDYTERVYRAVAGQ